MSNIVSVVPKGKLHTYDLEVDHLDHQFYLANGVLTSNSHSVSYAIDSYYAAWLYTYHPKEWLATVLQSETGHPDKLADTISQIKQLGWNFSEADVNLSGAAWTFSDEVNAFIPPLLSLKKIGETAVEEIVATRPFKDLRTLLWDREGNWYHSKMNKGAFEALCLVEAFASLEEMRTGKIRNHRQLHEILIGNYDKLKKGPKGMSASAVKKLEKKGEVVPDILDVLINETSDVADWSREEKIKLQEEVMSSVDNKLLFPGDILKRLLSNTRIMPLTQIPSGVKSLAWFLVRDVEVKHTKKGKGYLSVKAQDHENKQVRLKVWGASDPTVMEPFTVWLCEAEGDERWGPSTSLFKCRKFDLPQTS